MADETQQPAADARVVGTADANTRADFLSYPRRVFIDALQTFFAEPNMLGGPNAYQWHPDDTKSKIVIAAEYAENNRVKNPNHMILVNRGPVRFLRLHFRNVNQERVNPILRKPVNPPDGSTRLGRSYSTMAQMDIQIVCFSRLPAEAETLAQIVTLCCLSFADLIRDKARLHKIDNPVVGNESPVQSADSQIMLSVVPVTVPILASLSWQTVRDPETIEVAPILLQVEDC